jgi:putative membrane protein
MMMGWILLFPLLLVVMVVIALGWRPWEDQRSSGDGAPRRPTSGQTPPEILKARYARGQITRQEYEEMRRDLEQ